MVAAGVDRTRALGCHARMIAPGRRLRSRGMTATTRAVVGRDREVKLLDRLLDEVRAGRSRFVVVTGEAGIGKTFLLAELTRRADARGWLALGGRAAEFERD